MILREVEVKEKDVLWKIGDNPEYAFLIAKGTFKFVGCKEAALDEFHTGAIIGEIAALLNNTPATTSVKAVTDGVIYVLEKQDLRKFLTKNPGLYLSFADLKYFE